MVESVANHGSRSLGVGTGFSFHYSSLQGKPSSPKPFPHSSLRRKTGVMDQIPEHWAVPLCTVRWHPCM